LITTGTNTSGGGGDFSSYSYDDFGGIAGYGTTDKKQENKIIDYQKANRESEQKSIENQKENTWANTLLDLGKSYLQYETSKNLNSQQEVDMNSGGHKTVDTREYLEKQQRRYGDYQEQVENIQDIPESELTAGQRRMYVQNSSGGLPNITGNKTLDIGVYGLLALMLFKVISNL